ncbi:MAG TPA: wax ester/triacylglycerol synthase domain-containing protein [Streptosporangiaceae bacterium]|nr:wax ester/triacylglycerol synthase domain-containing protein [Streptosporangiaceae bacterium]
MPADVGRPLSPEDLAILALENETVAGHTCKVIVLRDGLDPGRLRASIAGRLHRAPLLSMRLAEVGGAAWWVPDGHVDVAAHVVQASPPETADDAGYRATVADIFQKHLDRSRPLWQIDVIPRLPGGGSALTWRIHHALADGSTAMQMASSVLWDDQPATGAGTAAGSAATRSRRGAAAARPAARPKGGLGPVAHHRLEGLRAAAREAPQPWLRSPFDGHIDGRRAVAFATIGLDDLHQAARAGGATVNDAVLTVVAGGVRRWLEAHHGHLGALRVKVPVSLHGLTVPHGHDDEQPGNRDSFFCLDLPLGSADPLERMAAVQRATRIRKQGHDAQHLDALLRQLARTPRLSHFVERVLTHPRSFALNVSNVLGPRQPVRVLGVPVQAMYSLAEIGEHHALRVAVVSLAGHLNFGLVADPTLLADVDHLAGAVHAEAAALTASMPGV